MASEDLNNKLTTEAQFKILYDLVDAEFELYYPQKYLYVIFLILLLLIIQVNYDHGVLPAATDVVMASFKIQAI